MFPKHCMHCHHLFLPKKQGFAHQFCRECAVLCQNTIAHMVISLKQAPHSSIQQVAQTLKVPQAFMQQLYKQQIITPTLSAEEPITQERCFACITLLEADEEVLCATCEQTLRQHIKGQRKPVQEESKQFDGSFKSLGKPLQAKVSSSKLS